MDLVALGALTYTSGGPYSEARLAFFALPLVAAFRLRPALTAAWTAAAIAVYVLISLPHPATRTGADVDAIVVHALFLMWAGAGAVVLSALLGERDRRLRALADERGRLVAQALTAEDRERQRLAELLHDDAIQNLLVARQELRDHHRRHDEDSYRRADEALAVTVDRLRGEIFELHPYVLDHAGLRAALTAHAESAARRAGARAVVEVDDAGLAEAQQQLVLSLARELLSNAARHSGASTIGLRLASDAQDVVLVVADDGARLRARAALAGAGQGHIGMATSAERAAAAGGTLRRRLHARRRHDDHRATAARRPARRVVRSDHARTIRSRAPTAPWRDRDASATVERISRAPNHPRPPCPPPPNPSRHRPRRAAPIGRGPPASCASSSPTTIPSIATASSARSMESGRYQIVGEARDGEAALRLIERHRPDVALLDLRMPALDALGVLRRLERRGRQRARRADLGLHPARRSSSSALAAGAAGYLSKDAPREEILVALDAVASGARIVQDSGADAHGRAPLVPVERALLIFLHDGWSVDELPAIVGLDADAVERHLLEAAIKLGTRSANDTLARALARGLLD